MKRYIYIILFSTLLFSCVTPKKTNYLQEPGRGVASYQKLVDTIEYKLQAGDRLYIKVSSLDEATNNLFRGSTGIMSQNTELLSYMIHPDGYIDYPFLEPVKVAGLTTRQTKDTLRYKLQPVAPNCDVDVRLANGFFTIVGNNNGKYAIPKERLNIFQALAMVGDIDGFTDKTKVHLLRPTPEGTKVTTFDVRSKTIIGSEHYYIQPNDVLYVESFDGQFFGMTSWGTLLATLSSSVTFGYLVYKTFFQ